MFEDSNHGIQGRKQTAKDACVTALEVCCSYQVEQYFHGFPDPSIIAPQTYTPDWTLLSWPGNNDIKLGLFKDYAHSVALYAKF